MILSMGTRKSIVIWTAISLLGCPANHCRVQKQAPKWPEHIQVMLDSTRSLKYDRGERFNINATRCLDSFFNGDPRTAHIDDEGNPFWDTSFGKKNMGCPFALDFRRPQMAEQVEYFVMAFKDKGLDADFVFADWEIDGPIEFNEAHAASKRCRRCRDNIKNIDDFQEFQKALRQLRCELQREVYAEPVKNKFPRSAGRQLRRLSAQRLSGMSDCFASLRPLFERGTKWEMELLQQFPPC